jgi:glycosyltransferase involved in cell wall biosynthesis
LPRILYIIDSLSQSSTAAQLLVLARGVGERGFEVHIAELAAVGPARLGTWAGMPTFNVGRRLAVDPLADLRLLKYVKTLGPDVVHTWDAVPGMFAALAVRRLEQFRARRKPPTAERPNRPKLIAGRYRIERWLPAWDSFVERRLALGASQYITNSPTVRDWCIANGSRDQRFTFIPPGVSPACGSNVSRAELLAELGLPAGAKLIGVIGRLVPDERVQDLIWAADLLRVLHDNLRMLIIGEGPLRASLEQYARMASDLDHIRFLDGTQNVCRIMPHLDVLWNGSENRSVSPSILDAMAAGVPVIASDVPVNRELVIHETTGYLVPIGHRSGRADRARYTDRIFTNPELATRLAHCARQRAREHFSADDLIQAHLAIYRELLR